MCGKPATLHNVCDDCRTKVYDRAHRVVSSRILTDIDSWISVSFFPFFFRFERAFWGFFFFYDQKFRNSIFFFVVHTAHTQRTKKNEK